MLKNFFEGFAWKSEFPQNNFSLRKVAYNWSDVKSKYLLHIILLTKWIKRRDKFNSCGETPKDPRLSEKFKEITTYTFLQLKLFLTL